MPLFPWFKTKASAAMRALSLYFPLPPWSGIAPRYDRLADEGYMKNSVVHACVREIASAAACVPWMVYRQRADGELEEMASHPLMDLFRRPNPLASGFELVETLMSHLYLSGNAYVEAAGPDHAPPGELYALRPDRLTVLPDPVEVVGGYEYRAGGQAVRFSRKQVLHLKLFHPLDDWYGLSPMEAAALAVDKLNQADRWNASLLKNSAVPSGALVSKKRLTDEQFDRLKQEMQQQMTGVTQARLPLLLEEDLDWKELGIQPKDLDWIEGLRFSALQVAQIYNVPPELIGLTPATHQNRREARKALYTEVVLPALSRLRDALNRWLTPRFDASLRLDFNTDRIDALAEDRESLWRRVNTARFLTLNEKRELLGYEPLSGGDSLPQRQDLLTGKREDRF